MIKTLSFAMAALAAVASAELLFELEPSAVSENNTAGGQVEDENVITINLNKIS